MNIGLDIHNHFDIAVKRKGKTIQTAKAENVVLNQLFDIYNSIIVYQSGSYLNRIVDVHLGTGSTTPAVTDTALGNSIYRQNVDSYSYSLESAGVCKLTVTKTVSESDAIGLLAEVGLGCNTGQASAQYRALVTRALITDSENNPITINKTSADILEITATVYFTLTVPTGYKWARGAIRGTNSLTGHPELVDTDIPADPTSDDALGYKVDVGTRHFMRFGGLGRISNASDATYTYSVWGITRPLLRYSAASTQEGYIFSPDTTLACISSDHNRYTSAAVASTAQNRSVTYLIKSIVLPGSLVLSFPNANIYPPKQLTLSLIGDGTTTDFDFPIPELSLDNVSVSINSVVQDPSTYTFGGKNFTMQQAWCSCDTKYLVKSGYVYVREYESGLGSKSMGFYSMEYPAAYNYTSNTTTISSKPATLNPRVYDFLTPKTVNTFKNTVVNSNADASARVQLEYSTDGETWTQAAELPVKTADTVTFSPISARYWRILNLPTTYKSSSISVTDADVMFGFDNVQPGIRFNTAPAQGDSIEVTCYCDYPMKNSNWRIDSIVSDVKYVRSVSP